MYKVAKLRCDHAVTPTCEEKPSAVLRPRMCASIAAHA
eukprot:COSAG01_NODE_79232_length_134_cov_26.971429_1_plen_37_part_10